MAESLSYIKEQVARSDVLEQDDICLRQEAMTELKQRSFLRPEDFLYRH